MTAKEIYQNETGNICPSNQIAYDEWYIDYVKWLENKIEVLIKQPVIKSACDNNKCKCQDAENFNRLICPICSPS